jgi:hypothetical protein
MRRRWQVAVAVAVALLHSSRRAIAVAVAVINRHPPSQVAVSPSRSPSA